MDGDLLRKRLQERLDATGKKAIPLARAIGRGRDYLSDILNGKKDTLSSDTLTPLARELECDERYFTDELFTKPGRPRRPATPEQLAEHLRSAQASGVFLKAWRQFRNLAEQDIADETRLSLGTIYDIESGNVRPDPEQVSVLAKAVNSTPGALQTQNPFETDKRVARLASITETLDQRDQDALLDMAEAFLRRQAS